MKCIINDQMALLRPPEGPLALYIAVFSQWASGQGYAPSSLRRHVGNRGICGHTFRRLGRCQHGALLTRFGTRHRDAAIARAPV